MYKDLATVVFFARSAKAKEEKKNLEKFNCPVARNYINYGNILRMQYYK